MNDYIGATGNFPIIDYIDYTSNILDKRIDDLETSNVSSNICLIISSNVSSIYSNNLRNELWEVNSNNDLCLIKSINYSGIPHTYINNSNVDGEIRFSVKNSYATTSQFPYDHSVKIDNIGKLMVYHKFIPIQALFPQAWYDVEGELFALKNEVAVVINPAIASLGAFQVSAINQISVLQALTGAQQNEILAIANVLSAMAAGNELNLFSAIEDFTQARGAFGHYVEGISTSYVATATTWLGSAFFFGAPLMFNSMADYMYREHYRKLVDNFSNAYIPSFTEEERRILYSCNDDGYERSFNDFYSNSCNFSLYQGFINSNIITNQIIPSLKSNKIMLGNITTPNEAYAMEMSGDLNLNMLYLNSTSLTSLLNQKQGNLTFNNPLLNTTNIITLKRDSSLTVDGSGNLSVVKTASLPLVITGNNWTLNYDSTLELSGNNLKVATATASKWTTNGTNIYYNSGNVGIGTNNPVSKLTVRSDYNVIDSGFCIDASDNTGVNNKYNFKIYPYVVSAGAVGYKFRVVNNTSTINDVIILDHSGNVGIGANPSYKLHIEDGSVFIGDSAYTSAGSGTANGYKIIFDNTYNGTAGSGNICNKLLLHNHSSFNAGFGIEQNALVYQSGNTHRFYTGTTSTVYGFLSAEIYRDIFNFFGNVDGGSGGYIRNASAGGSAYTFIGLLNAAGTFSGLFLNSSARTTDGGVNTLTLRNDAGDLRLSAKSDSPYIYLKNSTGNVGINNNSPSYKLDVNGSLNSTSLYIATRLIQDHLFNNSGRGHNSFSDFNTPTDFGCHFIQGTGNSPGVNGAGQYYSMSLGIGNEYYNGSPSGNYKTQIAFGRNVGNPYLCIRYMEAGSWGSWNKISAGLADNASTASFRIRSPSESTASSLDLGTPFNASAVNKCSIIAQGVSSYSRSDLHFCLNNAADNTTQATVSDARITIKRTGNIGFGNTVVPTQETSSTSYFLHLGNSQTSRTEDWNACFHKSTGNGGTRMFNIGYTGDGTYDFYECIGDIGYNNTLATWQYHLAIVYNAPDYCCIINSGGNMTLHGQFYPYSDEKIKTDIETIDSPIEKICDLRGVYYTDIIHQEKKIGLIAQEVEMVIPEVVTTEILTDTKAVNYNGLVGLLIEGIKEQNKIINNLIKRIEVLENNANI